MSGSTGAVQLPLEDGYITTTINIVADPARDVLLDLIEAALIGDLDAAYQVIKSQINADGYVVNDKIPFDPSGFLKTNNVKFPMIALWRGPSVTSAISILNNKRTTDWRLQYVMPQLSNTSMGKAQSLLNAVLASVEAVIANGYYPTFNDGYAQFGDIGFFQIEVGEAEAGLWAAASTDGDGIMHPAIQITIRTIEVCEPTFSASEISEFDGATITHYIDTEDPLLYFITNTDYQP